MSRNTVLSWVLFFGFLQAANAVVVSTNELNEVRAWTAAKLLGRPHQPPTEAGLLVLANHDPVQKNSRAGKPLRLASAEYSRGLYCHANSRILVRLPAPGRTFQALIGIDSNEQTSGGRGSVEFSVQLSGSEKFRSGILREGMAAQPVSIDLGGATEFQLQIDATPDGIACDQSDWAEAKVILNDGRELSLADLPLSEKARIPYSTDLPFSFSYGGKPATELLKNWELKRTSRALDPSREEHLLIWTGPDLMVRCTAIEYRDFPTVEWTV